MAQVYTKFGKIEAREGLHRRSASGARREQGLIKAAVAGLTATIRERGAGSPYFDAAPRFHRL
jgi:hypothetical protein